MFVTPEWQQWVSSNLDRGCSVESMVDSMVNSGEFKRDEAFNVIKKTKESSLTNPTHLTNGPAEIEEVMVDLPFINTHSNQINAGDRIVDILMTNESPRVVLLGNVLSDEECDELVAYATPNLQRSSVVGETQSERLDDGRTSQGTMFQRAQTEILGRIEKRLAILANWPAENGEGLQVLRYGPGNEYKPHFDWFDPDKKWSKRHMEQGGQRVGTFVIYLSEVEAGGGTIFPKVGLEVFPRKGNAVFFVNATDDGVPDPQTLHGGSPVIRGVKFVANKWLRERSYY